MDKPAQWALVGAAWFLAISVAVFGFLSWQRLGRTQAAPAPTGAGVAMGTLPTGNTAVCPVTGKRVLVGPNTPTVTYLGHTYYFSDDVDANGVDARTRFLMDPDSWLKRQGGPAQP